MIYLAHDRPWYMVIISQLRGVVRLDAKNAVCFSAKLDTVKSTGLLSADVSVL